MEDDDSFFLGVLPMHACVIKNVHPTTKALQNRTIFENDGSKMSETGGTE